MSRNEMINDVVRCYFEGGNWQSYLKQLSRDELDNISQALQDQEHEDISKSIDCEYDL